jgi:hypothetical protein
VKIEPEQRSSDFVGLGLSIFFKPFGRESSQEKGKDKAFPKGGDRE